MSFKESEELMLKLINDVIINGRTCQVKSREYIIANTFNEHLKHVQKFLIEMYQTMIDPIEDPPKDFKIKDLCELLLTTARNQREQAQP